MSDSQAAKDEWPSAEQKAKNVAQAKALRVQAEKGGLRFSAYLPPGLADWLLGLIEKGTFDNPNEAVFVILGEHQDLEPHTDFRRDGLGDNEALVVELRQFKDELNFLSRKGTIVAGLATQ